MELYPDDIQSKLELSLEHYIRDSGLSDVAYNTTVIPLFDMMLLHENETSKNFSIRLAASGKPVHYTHACKTALAKLADQPTNAASKSWDVKMEEDKKCKSKDVLEDWLKNRGVDEDNVGDPADKLLVEGFNKPSTLLDITFQELTEYGGIEGTVARHVSNKLKVQPLSCKLNPIDSALNLQQQSYWFKMSGAISWPVSHAWARSELYKLASAHGGLYPPDDDPGADKRLAFATFVDIGEADRPILSFAVVFRICDRCPCSSTVLHCV